MRLLSFALPLLLLVASSVLATPSAPNNDEEWPTTVEILAENVTYTIVHDVTEPTVINPEIETDDDMIAEAKRNLRQKREDYENAKKYAASLGIDVDNNDATISNNVPTTTETATTEEMIEETTTEVTPTTMETVERKRLCTCQEKSECRRTAMQQMDLCMSECGSEHLESLGRWNGWTYSRCFANNKASIVEAEDCLFKGVDFCDWNDSGEEIVEADWDELISISYSSTANASVNNAIWEKHEPNYVKMKTFLYCTRHCIHNHLRECVHNKGCALQMPSRDDFKNRMKSCTKKNPKITVAMLNTCTCLAWQKGAKEFQGSCVYVGNQYYIDRA